MQLDQEETAHTGLTHALKYKAGGKCFKNNTTKIEITGQQPNQVEFEGIILEIREA